MKARDIGALEEALDHHFSRPELLQQALTHSSHAREAESRNGGEPNFVPDNEQLEFLGDAVLGFVTSQELFQRFPQFSEGELSKLRAYLVSEKHLIRAAKQLQIGRYLRLGRGEDKSGGRSKTALLVDALEAVVAAMYLDAGLEKARALILDEILEPELEQMAKGSGDLLPVNDFKSALQETAHSMGWSQPSYVLVKERGPEHQKTFTVEARVRTHGEHQQPEIAARGEGLTKKQAEQGAASKALEYLRSLDNPSPKSARRSQPAEP
ncbi:MAG: ribonuclease III [Acidobacteriia bacterium]|nr:ribonuclease III [Terriglobia bacterium]